MSHESSHSLTDSNDFIGIALICTTYRGKGMIHAVGNNENRCNLALVVLEDEDHVEISQMKFDTLEMNSLHFGQGQNKCRLQ